MADVTQASNVPGIEGKWLPYYNKPFYLGRQGRADSEDGIIYITTEDSSDLTIEGWCTSEYNCNFYYKLVFTQGGGGGSYDNFHVLKLDLSDTVIDTIYASSTVGNGRYWANQHAAGITVTIDTGVYVRIISRTGFDNLDEYTIKLPSAEKMRKRRIYHGGYSTFISMPIAGKSKHTDIIPTNLINRGTTTLIMPPLKGAAEYNPQICRSMAGTSGNVGLVMSLEWSVDETAGHAIAAGNATVDNQIIGEKWNLGSIFYEDIDPSIDDVPAYAHFPGDDVNQLMPGGVSKTGSEQFTGLSVSSREGYAKLRLQFQDISGFEGNIALNQIIQIYLMIT